MMWEKIFLVPALLMVSLPNAAGARERRTSGTRVESYTNRALDAAVGVLSTHEEAENEGPPNALVDGNPITKWSSAYTEPQQLALDIGKVTSLKKMRVLWAKDAAKDYDIYTSRDGIVWKKIWEKRGARKGPRTDTIRLWNNKTRFIGLDLIKRTSQKGFSISEIEILSTETKTKPSELVRAKILPAEIKAKPADPSRPEEPKEPARDGIQVSELKRQLETMNRRYKTLERQRNALPEQIKRLQDEKDSLTMKLTNMQTTPQRSTGSRTSAVYNREQKRLQKRISGLENDLATADANYMELEKKIDNLKAREKKVDAETERADRLEDDLAMSDIKRRKLEKQIKHLRKQKNKVDAEAERADRLKDDLATTHANRIEMEKRIKQLKTQNEKTAFLMKAAKDTHEAAEATLALAREEAETMMRQMTRERVDMHYNLAVVYQKHAMYEDAEREYLKCIKISPDEADVHYNLAILYDDRLNNNDLAGEHYGKFLALRPPGDNPMKVREWMFNVEQEKRLGVEAK